MLKIIFALIVILLTANGHAAPLTPIEALNVAGRQRMLTQRIVKAYVQMVIDVAPDRSRQALESAVVLFDNQIDDLKEFASTQAQKATVAEMAVTWRKIRVIAVAPIDRSNVESLDYEAEKMLNLAQTLAGQVEESSKILVAKQVNLAGRQRMLCQRLTKLYMLRSMGNSSAQIRTEMDTAILEFGAILTLLKQARESDVEIKRELNAVSLNWDWFKQALELDGAMSYRLLVADSSESILASMENVVSLYEKLATK